MKFEIKTEHVLHSRDVNVTFTVKAKQKDGEISYAITGRNLMKPERAAAMVNILSCILTEAASAHPLLKEAIILKMSEVLSHDLSNNQQEAS
jgi:hypothetical protein